MNESAIKPKKKRRSLKRDVRQFMAGIIWAAMDTEGFAVTMREEKGWDLDKAKKAAWSLIFQLEDED